MPFLDMPCRVAAPFPGRRRRSAEVGTLPTPTLHRLTSSVVVSGLAVAVIPPADLPFRARLGWLLLPRGGVTAVTALTFLMAAVTAGWGAAVFGEPLGRRTGLGHWAGALGWGTASACAR